MNLELKCFTMNSNNMFDCGHVLVSKKVFGYSFNLPLVHQVVSSYLINNRQGSRSQKSRSEVAGSNKKPWRQKGTGRARSGSLKSPIWRSGGVTFAATSKKYNQKINKKMYRNAIKSILSKLVYDNRLFLIENFFLEKPKTKLLLEILKPIIDNKRVLIVTDFVSKNLFLASRNLFKIKIIDVYHMNPISLVNCNIVLLSKTITNKIETSLI